MNERVEVECEATDKAWLRKMLYTSLRGAVCARPVVRHYIWIISFPLVPSYVLERSRCTVGKHNKKQDQTHDASSSGNPFPCHTTPKIRKHGRDLEHHQAIMHAYSSKTITTLPVASTQAGICSSSKVDMHRYARHAQKIFGRDLSQLAPH